MKANSLRDLLVDQCRDMIYAERALVKALPKMAKNASSDELKDAIESHLTETENQVTRLEDIMRELGVSTQGKKCHGMDGLIAEGEEIMKMASDPDAADCGIICAAQKVEHYEIATYGTLKTWAETLGLDRVAELLDESLEEEYAADKKLTAIAESGINVEAMEVGEDEN